MNSINQSIELIRAEIIALENDITLKQSEIETAYNNAIKEAARIKKEAEKEVTTELKNIENLTAALTALGGKIEKAKPAKPGKQLPLLTVTETYSEAITIKEKIAYTLYHLTNGYKEDIAKQMAEWDKLDFDLVIKQISGVLSSLKSNGQITAIKDGRRDLYTLVI